MLPPACRRRTAPPHSVATNRHNTTAAADGHQALEIADRQHFDVAIVDMNMPGMTGLELLDKVKSEFPEIQVSMISAYGDSENHDKAMNSGAKEFFTKPIDFDSLKAELKDILAGS